ncbi:hypothetical protein [Vandammella animalimorsus]|nr:hypothetical protein [Vandammella animalimorsus]
MPDQPPQSAWARFWQGLFTYLSAEIIVKGLIAIVSVVMLFWFLRGGR